VVKEDLHEKSDPFHSLPPVHSLDLVAVLINAPALFYMSFALIATLAACHIQSNLATKALRIDRIAPKSVHVGELVTVEIVLWSDRKIKRPLVTVDDNLPPRLHPGGVGPSLPVAPAFDLPVRTMYQFTPLKEIEPTVALRSTTRIIGIVPIGERSQRRTIILHTLNTTVMLTKNF
jgi:hypothetical protein